MRLIAENQLVGTTPGWACIRNLYVDANGNRVSITVGSEFEVRPEKTKQPKNIK